MATPEAKVKDEVVKILKKNGVYYFFPATGGYGRSGIPDIISCYMGIFIAIECKANGNKPTALQLRELAAIDMAGGIALVIDENSLCVVEKGLEMIRNWSEHHDSIVSTEIAEQKSEGVK